MKKLLSLLLCLALLAGLFAVSAAAEEEIAAPEDEAPVEDAFTAAVGPQAFAVTMAAWLGGDIASDDPLFLWDAAGWYAAWLYRTEGCDLLSPEEIGDFLCSLGGDGAPMPEGWEDYGVVRVLRSRDGSELYDFVQHKTEIDAMLGVDTMVSFVDSGADCLTTILSCYYEDDLSAEWMYRLRFERAEDELFPYHLSSVLLLDRGPQMDAALDFSWNELLAANTLGNVLAHYPAVRIGVSSELGEDDGLSGTWLFESGGAFARVSYGEDYTGGEYRGCYFELEKTEDGAERVRVGHIEEEEEENAFLGSYLTDYLKDVVIVTLEQEEDDLIRLVCTFRGGYRERISIDRGTLVLREIDYSSGDMLPPSVTSFDYMKPAPVYPFLAGWEGPLRTVTTVWEEFRENTETHEWEPVVKTCFDRLPADWEYLPYESRWGEYTVYMDEGFTKPYAYPGDGADYTLYLTTAKG